MAPKSKKRQSSTYDSDNGFVANDSGNEGATHRAKKARTTKSKSDPSSSSFKSASAANPAGAGGEKKIDANGDTYWELSRLRRVTVSSFKGKTLVNVREYYEKDGQELPGKKGISMPIDQFSSMIKLLPNIEAALKEKGETLPRPEYTAGGGKDKEEEQEDEGDGVDDENQSERASEEEEEDVKPRLKKDKKSKNNGVRKKNIEATSDEDEDE